MPEFSLRQLDRRVVVDTADRIVVKVEQGWGVPIRPLSVVLALVTGAAVAIGAWTALQPNIGILGSLSLGLLVAAIPFAGIREVTLVVSVPEDAVFFEFRNLVTRRKTRKQIGPLHSVGGVEVRQHVDTDLEIGGPYFALGLKTEGSATVPVWYGASREAAERLGSTILELRERCRPA